MSNTNETTKKEIKQAWSKIINKNKDSVIIVPPHRTDQKIDPITLSWDEFNENFVFDEKDKTHCYTKPDSKYAEIFKKFKKNTEKKTLEKDVKKAIKSAEPVLDKAKKEIDQDQDQDQKKEKVVSKVKKEVTTNKKPPRKRQTVNNSSNYEYTMSIGEMIKNSGKLR